MEAANMVSEVKTPRRHVLRVTIYKTLTLDHVGTDPLRYVLYRSICTLGGGGIADACMRTKRRYVQSEESTVSRIRRAICHSKQTHL